MSDLAESQALFWRAARSEVPSEALEACFVGDGRLDAAARLRIYRSAYFVRQVNALRELFPRVAKRLGDGPFARTASRYVGAAPSSAHAVEGVGAAFPAWLRSAHGEAIGELAALELASFEVFVAPDERPLALAAARSPAFAEAPLRVGEHVRILELSRALLTELGHVGPPEALAGSASAACRPARGTLALWRAEHRVLRLELSAREARALEAAQRGIGLGALCSLLDEAGSEPAFVRDVLLAWFERGWLVEPGSSMAEPLGGSASMGGGT